MQFSILALIAGAVAVNAVAIPGSSSWTPQPSKSAPTCGSGKTPVQCASVGLVNALNCVNILNGNSVSVPISILSGREVDARTDEEECPEAGGYCCASAGLVNALNCINVLNGNDVSIPISILSL